MLLAGLLGTAAAGAVACGKEEQGKLLSSSESQELVQDLDRVLSRFDDGECEGAASALTQAEVDASSMSPEVDEKLRERIDDGLSRLRTLLDKECESTKTKTTDTTPTVTETTPTTTTPTETTQTTETTTSPDTTPEPGPPVDDGSGGVSPPPDSGGAEGGP